MFGPDANKLFGTVPGLEEPRFVDGVPERADIPVPYGQEASVACPVCGRRCGAQPA